MSYRSARSNLKKTLRRMHL